MPVGTPTGFGSNPARGRPSTTLTRRTTAGQHRIPRGRGGFSSGGARPIEDMPKVFRHMREAHEGLPRTLIRPLAEAVRDEVADQGRRYKLRGTGGKKVALGAKTKAAMNSRGISDVSRFVDGVPAGFWRIVEDGSERHLIAGRYRRGGGRYTVRGAASDFGFNWGKGTLTSGADLMNRGSPVNVYGYSKGQSNDGWAQYVDHPGHRPLGKPWRRAMNNSQKIMDRMTTQYATREFTRAFFR